MQSCCSGKFKVAQIFLLRNETEMKNWRFGGKSLEKLIERDTRGTPERDERGTTVINEANVTPSCEL